VQQIPKLINDRIIKILDTPKDGKNQGNGKFLGRQGQGGDPKRGQKAYIIIDNDKNHSH
jgi:hypothetical protein